MKNNLFQFQTHLDRFMAITQKASEAGARPSEKSKESARLVLNALLAYKHVATLCKATNNELPTQIDTDMAKMITDFEQDANADILAVASV